MPNLQFETQRLLLIPTGKEDAQFLFQLMNSPNWLQFIGDRNIRSIEDAENYIEDKIQSQFESLGFASYTISKKNGNQKLGICGLYNRDGIDGIDLGFALLPEFEKQGYAYEASERIKKAALENFGLKRLSAITSEDNIASQNLLKKLSFKLKDKRALQNKGEEFLIFELTSQK